MKFSAKSTLRRHRTLVRAGVAPLEFVMALPFIMILSGIIFTMTRASLIKADAIMQARNQAWHNRYGHGSGGSLSAGLSAQALGMFAGRSASSGLQSGSGSRSARVQYLAPASRYLTFGTASASAHHAVFSGPWDHEVLQFRSQPPMVIDPRSMVFAGGAALEQFAQLSQSIQPPASALQALQNVQKAVATIQNQLNQLNTEINRVEDRLRDLREKLRLATDNAVIRELQREIVRVETMLRKMKEGREKLQKGLDLVPR